MTGLRRQVLAGLLQWQHGRVIAFPGEEITPQWDPIAYGKASGKALVEVANEVSPGDPEGFVLSLLQTHMRVLLESFLNSYDLGLDGRPAKTADGFPKLQLRLPDLLLYVAGLDELGAEELDGLESCLGRLECVPGHAEEEVARLLAEFYRAFPGLVAWSGAPTCRRELPAPPTLDETRYLTVDREYRQPVVDFGRWVRRQLPWALKLCVLHGSLATEDYEKGYSDFDTFAVVRREVTQSPAALVRLRKQFANAWEYLYRVDPLQHHGVMLAAEQDMGFYPQPYLPFEVIRHGCMLHHPAGGPLVFRERDASLDRMAALYSVRQNFRWLASSPAPIGSLFEHKFHLNLLLLVPALYYQAIGEHLYKKSTFERIEGELPEGDLAPLARASEVRKAQLYELPASLNAGLQRRLAEDRVSWLERRHTLLRQVGPGQPLVGRVGPHYFVEAAELVENLVRRAERARDCPRELEPLARGIAGAKGWEDEPRFCEQSAYSWCYRRVQELVSTRVKGASVLRFGSAVVPGISDIDLIVVVPDEASDCSALNSLPEGLAAEGPVASSVLVHPPSMIVPMSYVEHVPKLYPIFEMAQVTSQGLLAVVETDEAAHARYNLAAMAEICCTYFLRKTVPALLGPVLQARQLLLTLSGLRYSLRVLRANHLERPGWDSFIADVNKLRTGWFSLSPPERHAGLTRALLLGIEVELTIIDAVREGLGSVLNCPHVMEGLGTTGEIAGALFGDTFFIAGWDQEQSLADMLALYRQTGRLTLILPAEIGVLLAYYATQPGPLRSFLGHRLVHRFGNGDIPVADEIRERCRLINGHYEFLAARGLEWGGVPHWSFNPLRDGQGDASWQNRLRPAFFGEERFTIRDYCERYNTADRLLQQARSSVDAGRFGAAVPTLQAILRIDPSNGAAHYLLGLSLHMLRCYDTALGHYTTALQAGYDPFWVLYNRGTLYRELGRGAEARGDLEQASALNPDHEGASRVLASLPR